MSTFYWTSEKGKNPNAKSLSEIGPWSDGLLICWVPDLMGPCSHGPLILWAPDLAQNISLEQTHF